MKNVIKVFLLIFAVLGIIIFIQSVCTSITQWRDTAIQEQVNKLKSDIQECSQQNHLVWVNSLDGGVITASSTGGTYKEFSDCIENI